MLAKLNSNRMRHSNEHEMWLFTSATILCLARFGVVNVCVNALDSRNVEGKLLQLSSCAHPHPRECMYQQQHCLAKCMAAGDCWKLMIQRCVVTQSDRWCMKMFRAEDSLLVARTSIPDFYVTPSSTNTISSNFPCFWFVLCSYWRMSATWGLKCRVSVGPRCSVTHLHGSIICSRGWNIIE